MEKFDRILKSSLLRISHLKRNFKKTIELFSERIKERKHKERELAQNN
jgi:hypothetical protein